MHWLDAGMRRGFAVPGFLDFRCDARFGGMGIVKDDSEVNHRSVRPVDGGETFRIRSRRKMTGNRVVAAGSVEI